MKTFKPIAMKCTQEQFEAIKPKLKGIDFADEKYFNESLLTNNVQGNINYIGFVVSDSNLMKERTVHEEWNEEVFLKACGIEVENIQPMENKEFDLKGYSVEVDNEEQAKQLQELAFKQGFEWYNGKTLQRLNEKFFSFNAYNENRIYYDTKHFKDEYVIKEIHFNDILKETLEQQLEKAEAEVKRLKDEIEEENGIKCGDWYFEITNYVIRRAQNKMSKDYLLSNYNSIKITDQELINKLNELIK